MLVFGRGVRITHNEQRALLVGIWHAHLLPYSSSFAHSVAHIQ